MPAPGLEDYLADWAPPAEVTADVIGVTQAAALAAVLDVPEAAPADGDALPPLWHWLYFLDWPAHRELGEDGHPAAGHFLPPIPRRRRMIAGGRLRVHAPLRLGRAAERASALADVVTKRGRSGEMVFVTVRHEIRQGGTLCLVEEHDLVYRSGDRQSSSTVERPTGSPRTGSPWRLPFVADPVLLFRISALTANAHRIHYDERYAREVEGYPGPVVHGPLLALLMAELVRRHAPDRTVHTLRYRLRRPVFAGDPFLVHGGPAGQHAANLAVSAGSGEPRAETEVGFG
jgi:hydroxyacyl-ACP dehydratase HTD2-like protein with hotdog domain